MSKIILGSGSPRRLELLSLLVDRDRIEVVRPDCDELTFEDVTNSDEINDRLEANARLKLETVLGLVGPTDSLVLCADTVVVASQAGLFSVLGKPDGPDWQARVTDWFSRFYVTGPHSVRTGYVLRTTDETVFGVHETVVEFRDDAVDLLPWYLATEEPLGKAGGYAIQGAGSVFARRVEGSLSNVIGLPLEAVLDTLRAWKFPLKTMPPASHPPQN